MFNRKFRLPLIAAAAFAALFGFGPRAGATTTSAPVDLDISATVPATCTIATTPVAVASYDPTAASDTTTTGTVAIQCTDTTPFNVELDKGGGVDVTDRRMSGPGADLLHYTLLQPDDTTNWGDTDGSDTYSDTGDGTTHNYTVNATVTKNQFVAPGSYTDTVNATVTY